ncbi:hypothetical protein [Aquimarina mytili]|uniref:DUF4149 domain-containing protein n=1 Tax=Aquimarina mytili TaxID=874423 RepID=A0A937D7Z8_9FLAO|nr:hypothetical protein [Aquimarina mytili]MBL0682227.1 hypothetical protein [Aquimarina mytili]
MKQHYINYAIATIFIWIGCVCAISFMEAWLKFQAHGITTKLGLGIGQLVFYALNKVEIACAVLVSICLFASKITSKWFLGWPLLLLPLFILGLQSSWLLPALDHRADAIISGQELPKSRLHLWYVILEIVKVISLFISGMKLFRIKNEN